MRCSPGEVQELLDVGYTPNRVASLLGVHHMQINRIIERHKLEFYVAFDEGVDSSNNIQLCSYDEWECEDALDDMLRKSFNFENVFLNEYEDVNRLSAYVKDKYKNLKRFLRTKKALFALAISIANALIASDFFL